MLSSLLRFFARYAASSHFLAILFLPAAVMTFALIMPGYSVWSGGAQFSHIWTLLLLVIVPVVATVAGAWLLGHSVLPPLRLLSCWDWLALAVVMSLGQWVAVMGAVTLLLFLVPAIWMDYLAGVFYYYMVPLLGIYAVSVMANALSVWFIGIPSVHCIVPQSSRTSYYAVSPWLVAATPVVAVALAWGMHFVLYEYVFTQVMA